METLLLLKFSSEVLPAEGEEVASEALLQVDAAADEIEGAASEEDLPDEPRQFALDQSLRA